VSVALDAGRGDNESTVKTAQAMTQTKISMMHVPS